MRQIRTYISLLSILWFAGVQAQSIINTSAISHDLDSAFSLVLDVGGNFSRGNSKVNDISASLGIGKSISEDASLWLLGGYNQLVGNDEVLQKTSFSHLRINYEIKNKVTINIYTQFQDNAVLTLDSRYLIGSNIDFDLNNDRSSTLVLGLFREWENYSNGEKTSLFRMNLAGNTEIKGKYVDILGFLYFQPNVQRWQDFRFIGEASVRVMLRSNLQLSLNGAVRYDNSPHNSLNSLDLVFNTSLRYELHRE